MSKNISDHIRDVVEDFKRKDPRIKSARDLNVYPGECKGNYTCHHVAQAVKKRVPGAKIVAGEDHTYIEHKGKFYDAEATSGVNSPDKLPFNKRNSS